MLLKRQSEIDPATYCYLDERGTKVILTATLQDDGTYLVYSRDLISFVACEAQADALAEQLSA